MGFKIERLEKIIEREISTILINSKDERLRFVTVTKVSLTNDCSIATLYYTILGNEEQKEATSKNLEKASGYIRSSLSKVLKVKKIPEIRLKYDESMAYGEKIENILKGITYNTEEDDDEYLTPFIIEY